MLEESNPTTIENRACRANQPSMTWRSCVIFHINSNPLRFTMSFELIAIQNLRQLELVSELVEKIFEYLAEQPKIKKYRQFSLQPTLISIDTFLGKRTHCTNEITTDMEEVSLHWEAWTSTEFEEFDVDDQMQLASAKVPWKSFTTFTLLWYFERKYPYVLYRNATTCIEMRSSSYYELTLKNRGFWAFRWLPQLKLRSRRLQVRLLPETLQETVRKVWARSRSGAWSV